MLLIPYLAEKHFLIEQIEVLQKSCEDHEQSSRGKYLLVPWLSNNETHLVIAKNETVADCCNTKGQCPHRTPEYPV